MGRNAQLLLVTLTNTFPPFSVVPIFLYLLILNAKARSNKGFGVLEVKFSNTYYFSPTAPKREGRALGQVLACSPWKHLQYVNLAQPGRRAESHFSLSCLQHAYDQIQIIKKWAVFKICMFTHLTHLQSSRSADLNSLRALPRGSSQPMGSLCATCWCWPWAP